MTTGSSLESVVAFLPSIVILTEGAYKKDLDCMETQATERKDLRTMSDMARC